MGPLVITSDQAARADPDADPRDPPENPEAQKLPQTDLE